MKLCLKRLLVMLTILVGIWQGTVLGQTFRFDLRKESNYKDLGSMMAHTFPDTLKVQHDRWPSMQASPTTWGNTFKIKSVHDFVKFYVYHDTNLVATPYTYRMAVHILGWNDPSYVSPTHSFFDTLTISYHPDSLHAYQDKYFKKYSGFHKFWVIITDVYFDNGSGWPSVTSTTPPGLNCRAEAEVWLQKFDKAGYGAAAVPTVTSNYNSSTNKLWVSWSNTQAVQPAQYEMEWTYVDDYQKVGLDTTTMSTWSASSLTYDFKNNSTRILTDSTAFGIPVIYNSGYLVYRVRLIRPDSVNFAEPVYSDWSLAESGNVGALAASDKYQISTSHMADALNWQYTISFAEQGKYKQSLNYFDGALKSRQSLTQFNTNPGKIIVGESVYDYEGRPAISLLPTPVTQNKIEYVPGMAINSSTNQTYQAGDFDSIPSTSVCPGEVGIPALTAGSLANKYYSTSNPQANTDIHKFIPNAKGFPFVHSIIAPENPNRVLKQGGVGDKLQIATGHETVYDYVSSDQTEIDRLFGTEIGRAEFYNKTVVTDPNGQTSYSISDNQGKIRATGLIGDGPDQSTKPVDPIITPSAVKINQNVLAGTTQNFTPWAWWVNKSFYVDAVANYDIQYTVGYPAYNTQCDDKYLSVASSYNYELFDQCGVFKTSAAQTIGTTGVISSSTPPTVSNSGTTTTILLQKGTHTVNKYLSINVDDVTAAVDSFMNNTGTCYKSEDWFIRQEVEKINGCPLDTSNPCEDIKKVMISQMFAGAKYGQYTKTNQVIYGTDTSFLKRHHFLNQVGVDSYAYHYQLCQDVLDRLPDTVYKNGKAFTNLATISVDSFIWLLNYNEKIAEALLPLHPEYCKLLNCNADSYSEFLNSIPGPGEAKELGYFLLEDLVNHDPLLGKVPADTLKRIRGGLKRFDSLAIAMAYCAGIDTGQFNVCYNIIYQNDIVTGAIANANPIVQENYYEYLISLYIGNRARVKQKLQDETSPGCGPCSTYRLQLIPGPLFPSSTSQTVGVSDSTHLTSLFANASNGQALPSWMAGALTNGTASAASNYTNAQNVYNSQAQSLCDSVVGQWMNVLGNCSTNQTLLNALRDSIKNYYCYGAGYGKPMTQEIMRGILVAKGFTINDLCNPFLVDFRPLPIPALEQDRLACKTYLYYADAKDFFNRSAVKSSINSLSTQSFTGLNVSGNNFENQLASTLGASSSSTINVSTAFSAASHRYVIEVTNTGNSQKATFWLQKRDPIGVCSTALGSLASWNFESVSCLLDDEAYATSALINQFSFVATITATQGTNTSLCELIGWNDKVPFLDTVSAVELGNCIACIEIKGAYSKLKDSLSTLGIKYGHPFFARVTRNFLNDYFGSQHTDDDFLKFLSSCGITDTFAVEAVASYYKVAFSTDLGATTFISNMNNTYGFMPGQYRYKDGITGGIHVLLDMRYAPADKVSAIKSYIETNVSSGNRIINFRWASNTVGVIFVPDYASFTPSLSFASGDLTLGTPVVCSLSLGSTYTPGKYYPVEMVGTLPPYKIARHINGLNNYLNTNSTAMLAGCHFSANYADWLHSDYYDSDKQAYLAYNNAITNKEHGKILESLSSANLMQNVGAYSSKYATYEDPYILNDQSNLFVSPDNQSGHAGNALITTLLGTLKNQNLTTYGVATIFHTNNNNAYSLLGGSLKVIRSGNGSTFWYRYFDSQDKLYDFWVNLPEYVTTPSQWVYDGLKVGSGDGQALRAAVNTHKNGSPNLTAVGYGYSDFSVGNVVQLENALLCNGIYEEMVYVDTLPCERPLVAVAISNGKFLFQQYRDSIRNYHINAFLAHLKANITEQLNLSAIDQKYQFTLYYYDRAGNLTQTVPPAGVDRLHVADLPQVLDDRKNNVTNNNATLPQHTKRTTYKYNGINNVYQQYTPDGGTVDYYFDKAGRVVFSQNDRQKPIGFFTYTLYDEQSRIKETGEGQFGYMGGLPYEIANSEYIPYQSDFEKMIVAVHRTDVVSTLYDTTAVDLQTADGMSAQENLRSRVSCVKYHPVMYPGQLAQSDPYHYHFATHYSYDLAGNVKTITQDFRQAPYKQRFKRIDYEYDLLSGKVNMLAYNRGFIDQFYQRYAYDADNRITKVETSKDGVYWDNDANYKYYDHGPLARMGLGDLKVQGVDYAYTVQGWLKAMNSDILNVNEDMGKDGNVTAYAKDLNAMTLDYFPDDYDPIGSQQVAHIADPTKGLYNGNIVRQSTSLKPFAALNKSYRYDPLNRISQTNYFNIDASNNLVSTTEFRNTYKYDADGNITDLVRMGNKISGTAQLMDSMKYDYTSGNLNNRLLDITDPVSSPYNVDIPQYTTAGQIRMQYDATGNLTKDGINGTDKITWTLYNKPRVVEMNANNSLWFWYDGAGNRIDKGHKTISGDTTTWDSEQYVRDASGNILAIYKNTETFLPNKTITDIIGGVAAAGSGFTQYINSNATNPAFGGSLAGVAAADATFTNNVITAQDASFYLNNSMLAMNMMINHPDNYLGDLRTSQRELISRSVDAASDFWGIYDASSFSEAALREALQLMRDNWSTTFAKLKEKTGVAETDPNYAVDSLVSTYTNYPEILRAMFVKTLAEADTADSLGFYNYIDDLVDNSTIFDPGSPASMERWMPVARHGLTTNVLAATNDDRQVLANFFNARTGTMEHIRNNAGDKHLLLTLIQYDFEDFINAVQTDLGTTALVDAVAKMPGMSVEKFMAGMKAVVPTAYSLYPANIMLRKSQQLAEHHIYGSSRVGVKEYWNDQYGYTWEDGDPVIDPDNCVFTTQYPWYSQSTLDFMLPTTRDYKVAGDIDNTTWYSTRLLGQKKYELTDHLGNVQATLLDRLTPIKSGGLVIGGNADIAAAWDYYPFGMFMPGRTVAGVTDQCITVSRTMMVKERRPKEYWLVPDPQPMYQMGPNINGWELIQTASAEAYLEVGPDIEGMNVYLMQNDYGVQYALDEDSLAPGVAYTLGANIDIDEGTSEADLQVVNYAGGELQVLGEVHVSSSGEYNFTFTREEGMDDVYVRVYTPDMLEEGQTPALSKIKLAFVEEYEDVWVPTQVLTQLCKGKDAYRFAYNGKEKDNEIKGPGNSLDFDARFYDARVGKFLSIDPKYGEYPWQSPYVYAANSPIRFIDKEGKGVGDATGERLLKSRTPQAAVMSYNFVKGLAKSAVYAVGGMTQVFEHGKTNPNAMSLHQMGNALIMSVALPLDNVYKNPTNAEAWGELVGTSLMLSSAFKGKAGSEMTIPLNSRSSFSYKQMKGSLAFEEKISNFTKNGNLKSEVVLKGEELPIDMSKTNNKTLIDHLTSDGSEIGDWSKMGATVEIHGADGSVQTTMDIHYYQNKKTGKTNFGYDYKANLGKDYFKTTPKAKE